MEIGGFDEKHLNYSGDGDARFRLRLRRYGYLCVPAAVARQLRLASSGKGSEFLTCRGHCDLV